jgi:hypothetical protein
MTTTVNNDDWDRDLINELNQCTRKLIFDWSKIASYLSNWTKERKLEIIITPELCRKQFALLNIIALPDETNQENHISNGNQQSEPDITTKKEKEKIKPLSTPYDHLSVEELLEKVEKNEEEMTKRKEEIFQRVLLSLGGGEEGSGSEPIQLLVDPAISAYQQAIAEKRKKEKKKQQRIEEAEEKERLDREREILRNRFDPNSEHAQGEYPEFFKENPSEVSSAQQKGIIFLSFFLLSIVSSAALDKLDYDYHPKQDHEIHLIHHFNIESLVQHEEFDRILSELEKELDSQAIGKDDGVLSELGEVLQFLDTTAKKQEQTKKADPSSIPTPSSAMVGMKNASTNEKSGAEPVSEKSKDIDVAASKKEQASSLSSSSAFSSSSVSVPSLGVVSSRPPRHQRLLQQQEENEAADKDDRDKANEDEDEDEDDDNSWRNQRNTMKNKSSKTTPPVAAVPQSSSHQATHSSSIAKTIIFTQSDDIQEAEINRNKEETRLRSAITGDSKAAETNSANSVVEQKIESRENQPQQSHQADSQQHQKQVSSPRKEQDTPHNNSSMASELLLEEIIPDLSIDTIPVSSGSLLSSAAGRRSKGGASNIGGVKRK